MNNLYLSVQIDSYDETVQAQYFSENKNKDHADEQTGLLGGTSYTSVTHDTNGESCC